MFSTSYLGVNLSILTELERFGLWMLTNVNVPGITPQFGGKYTAL